MIDEDEWQRRPPDPVGDVRGRDRAGERDESCCAGEGSTDQHVVPLRATASASAIDADLAGMPSFGQPLPLRDGDWDVFVAARARRGRPAGRAGYDHAGPAHVTGDNVAVWPKGDRCLTSGHERPG